MEVYDTPPFIDQTDLFFVTMTDQEIIYLNRCGFKIAVPNIESKRSNYRRR